MTIRQFLKAYPTDDACLDHVMRTRYGQRFVCAKCGKAARYYRIKSRPAYECEWCGQAVYPCVGTPFEKSRTPLQYWFFAMYLFCASRNGVAAKELQRQLGVTYKCAFRMARKIREYVAVVDGDGPIGGHKIVEADKAFIGGRDKMGEDDKVVVLGMVVRGGEVVAEIVPDRRTSTIVGAIKDVVLPGTRIATDGSNSFRDLHDIDYHHRAVNHAAKEYVRAQVHTNTIEAFWGSVKRAINSTYIHVSPKHLDKYLGEFECRFNLRAVPGLMFQTLIQAIAYPTFPQSPRPVSRRAA